MRRTSSSLVYYRWLGLSLAIIIVVLVRASFALADQQVTEPKLWCDSLMTLLSEKKIEELIVKFQDNAGGRVRREVT